jgi:hypothetical protein
MKFNQNAWSVKDAIQKRVQIEDLKRWGSEDTTLPPKPRLEARSPSQRHVNWFIFFTTQVYRGLLELKP